MKPFAALWMAVAFLTTVAVVSVSAAEVTVVSTFPPHHAAGVDPAINSIKIRFSAPVSSGGWSFYTTQYGEQIISTGDPVFEEGGLVCRLPVLLKPDTTYSFSVNSSKGGHFRSAADPRVMVTPCLVTFSTASSSEKAVVKSDPSELRVESTFPSNGATDVDPATDKLRIRFSGPVDPGGYSMVRTEIEFVGKPVISEGNKLWVFPVKLAPGTTYSVEINSEDYKGFRSASDPKLSVIPYLLKFSTSGKPAPGATGSARKWREDLAFLAKELPARHINLFAVITKEQWDKSVSDLDKQIPDLKEDEIMVGLMKLVASVGDEHTALNPRFTNLPIGLYWFKDGIFVMAAPEQYKDALACRVDGIGSMTIDQACKAVSVLIAHSNEGQLKNTAPWYLAIPQILRALKIAPDADHVMFRLTTPKGSPLTMDVHETKTGDNVKPLPAVDYTQIPKPLYLSNQDVPHWARYLDKDDTIYFQYNQCVDNDKHSFANTRNQLDGLLKDHPDARFVIDMRFNGGGSSPVLDPFIDSLKDNPVNRRGRLFVLIGRRTFSSAILNAVRLRNETKAVFIGEPTGGSPNHYGEVKTFELPNSKITVQYSTKHFTFSPVDTPAFMPDMRVEIASKDWLAGADPVLDAALKYEPPK